MAAEMAGTWPSLWFLGLFFVGAIAMRGAGCTYNDLVDQEIDAQVARTRSRPLPSGQVTRRQAQIFMVAQALIGFFILIQFNRFAIGLGLMSLPIVAAYPFMKRITDFPQVVLGLAFSWGALMGYAVVFGTLNHPAPFLLYGAVILWTMGYDTIYAHQDQEDDALIGVKSTARTFGQNSKTIIGTLYAGTALLVAAAMVTAEVSLIAYLGLAGFAGHLAWQYVRLDTNDSARCLIVFRSNLMTGLLLFGGLLASAVVSALI